MIGLFSSKFSHEPACYFLSSHYSLGIQSIITYVQIQAFITDFTPLNVVEKIALEKERLPFLRKDIRNSLEEPARVAGSSKTKKFYKRSDVVQDQDMEGLKSFFSHQAL